MKRNVVVVLVLVVAAFASGVASNPALSALIDGNSEKASCSEGSIETLGLVGASGTVVRLCYPPTWYVEAPRTVALQNGGTLTGTMALVRTVRLHEIRTEMTPGFFVVASTIVHGILQVIGPETAPNMGNPPCMTDDPIHQDGELRTCRTSSSRPGDIGGKTMIETVYFLTPDGYRLEGRAFPPYSPNQLPNDEELGGLAEQWPSILAEMTEIARDFALRADERAEKPLRLTPTP